MKRITFLFLLCIAAICANAQIGYQVAVVDQTTGEPKANTSVSVTITITDNDGTVILTDTQSAITNEFGVISLQIGDAATFDNTDWGKLPLWIAATVDGVSLGKTQILNVPVAEYAKQAGILTKEILKKKTWTEEYDNGYYIKFKDDYCTYYANGEGTKYNYYIVGNNLVFRRPNGHSYVETFIPEINAITFNSHIYR